MNKTVPSENCKFVQETGKITFSTVTTQEWQIDLSQKVPEIQSD